MRTIPIDFDDRGLDDLGQLMEALGTEDEKLALVASFGVASLLVGIEEAGGAVMIDMGKGLDTLRLRDLLRSAMGQQPVVPTIHLARN